MKYEFKIETEYTKWVEWRWYFMINLKNCRVIIREQKKNSVLADTVILGHNLLTNIIKVRASAMAYRPKEPVGLLVFLENKI